MICRRIREPITIISVKCFVGTADIVWVTSIALMNRGNFWRKSCLIFIPLIPHPNTESLFMILLNRGKPKPQDWNMTNLHANGCYMKNGLSEVGGANRHHMQPPLKGRIYPIGFLTIVWRLWSKRNCCSYWSNREVLLFCRFIFAIIAE